MRVVEMMFELGWNDVLGYDNSHAQPSEALPETSEWLGNHMKHVR